MRLDQRAVLPEAPAFAGAQGGSWDDGDDDEGAYTADGRLLTNIVMMGMGEPLYNFDNVRDALKIVMDGDGLALSKRRITLSTSWRGADDGARGQGNWRQSGRIAARSD